jgi:hypothetical protein
MKDIIKKTLAMILFFVIMNLVFFSVADAYSVRVRGYYKPSTGKYVMPHYRSSPNSTKWDNWSTQGNYNPYTGKKGYKSLWSW